MYCIEIRGPYNPKDCVGFPVGRPLDQPQLRAQKRHGPSLTWHLRFDLPPSVLAPLQERCLALKRSAVSRSGEDCLPGARATVRNNEPPVSCATKPDRRLHAPNLLVAGVWRACGGLAGFCTWIALDSVAPAFNDFHGRLFEIRTILREAS